MSGSSIGLVRSALFNRERRDSGKRIIATVEQVKVKSKSKKSKVKVPAGHRFVNASSGRATRSALTFYFCLFTFYLSSTCFRRGLDRGLGLVLLDGRHVVQVVVIEAGRVEGQELIGG